MSLIRRGVHIVSKQLAYLFILLLVCVLISAGIVYWLSDAVEQRQSEISAWASDQIGYPVTIGRAGIYWLGLSPKLELESVSISNKNSQNDILDLDDLYIGLDILASIEQGEPVLNDMTMTGLTVTVERDLSGNISLKGFNPPSIADSDSDWLSWVNIINQFELLSITVHYSDQLTAELSGKYTFTNVLVNHDVDSWNTTGTVLVPPQIGKQQVQFQAEAAVERDAITDWQWQVKSNQLRLDTIVQSLIWEDLLVEKGVMDVSLSGKGLGTLPTSLTANLAVSDSIIKSESTANLHDPVVIKHAAGLFEWQRRDNAWQLSGQNIALSVNGEIWPETGFAINKNNDNSWIAASNYLRLSDLSALALLSEHSPEFLRKQQPAGDIESLNIQYSDEQGITGLSFRLSEGAVEPWNDYPGITGLTLSANWNNGLAEVRWDSHNVNLYADKWLDNAVFFDSVSGKLELQKSEKTWVLKSNEFRVWNDDLTLQLDGQVEQKQDGEIVNNIKLTLADIVVNKWQEYVPQKILSTAFKEWSGDAFQAGTIIDGEIEWVGKVSSFPYKDDDSGFFTMKIDAEDVQLHYAAGWPDLLGVTGTITGNGHALTVKSNQGKVANFDFADVTTVITRLDEDEPILKVVGDLSGTTKQAALFLQNSPLNDRFGQALKSISFAGESNIQLNLMVPLVDADNTEALGYVTFVDSKLDYTTFEKAGLRNINGQLHFDNDGVYAENITAQLLNKPVKINVKPNDGDTQVSLTGTVSTEEIKTLWPEKVPTFINGKTDYTVDMTVIEKSIGDFYLNTELTSDLQGIEIVMPKPFAKLHDTKRTFSISMVNVGDEQVYSSKYGNEVNVIAVPNKKDLRAGIKFGEGQAELPNNGIKIRGRLAELSIDEWLEWSKESASTSNEGIASTIDDISMTIDSLTAFKQTITALNYSVNKDAQGWRVQLTSDQTKGEIYWPADFSGPVPLVVNLNSLSLILPEGETDLVVKPEEQISLWPAMNINIDALKLDDIDLGALALRASRTSDTWAIDSASIRAATFTVDIIENSSIWRQTAVGQKTTFSLRMNSHNLEETLANLGYQQAITSKNNTLEVQLAWPSHPLAFSRDKMSGHLRIDMGKGKLNDIEPGAAGRIFGLMSITALPRRLSLDFSELFSSGFTFDFINGDFKLADGHAMTENLTLDGSAAKIEMVGDIDLVNERYNQKVKVTPNVSSSLPLAGAVAGGPIGLGVGAALLVVDKLSGKLFGKNIVNLISYKYNLTGPWSDPQLTVVKPETQ